MLQRFPETLKEKEKCLVKKSNQWKAGERMFKHSIRVVCELSSDVYKNTASERVWRNNQIIKVY